MGLFSSLFGDGGKGAARSQAAENKLNRELIERNTKQARSEIFDLFPAAQEARKQGTQAALDIFGETIPQQLDVFQRGNVGAQRALTQGLPQIQAALLGQPVDFSQIQPQKLSFNTDFAQQQVPDFTTIQDALQPSRDAIALEQQEADEQEGLQGVIGRLRSQLIRVQGRQYVD